MQNKTLLAEGHALAERLSVPERSAALREGIARELQKTLRRYKRHEPTNLDDAALRQTVLEDMTGNAKVIHGWDVGQLQHTVRIAMLAQSGVRQDTDDPLPAQTIEVVATGVSNADTKTNNREIAP